MIATVLHAINQLDATYAIFYTAGNSVPLQVQYTSECIPFLLIGWKAFVCVQEGRVGVKSFGAGRGGKGEVAELEF